MQVIDDFHGEHDWASNFSDHGFWFLDIWYPTNEHFYQAWKGDLYDRERIASLSTPGKAKRAGRKIKLPWNWDVIKEEVMEIGLFQKFTQNPDALEKLCATKGIELVEGNNWHDNYWGNCRCDRCAHIDGQNKLGKMLMNIRSKIMDRYYWAGIGARKTPPEIIKMMKQIGFLLAVKGGVCNSGAAKGADQAFGEGAYMSGTDVIMYVPWMGFECDWLFKHRDMIVRALVPETHTAAMESVKEHPAIKAGKTLTQGVTKLHARNYLIVEGCKFVVCWSPTDEEGFPTGGTGQACLIARNMGIPVYNLYEPNILKSFKIDIEERKDELPDSL